MTKRQLLLTILIVALLLGGSFWTFSQYQTRQTPLAPVSPQPEPITEPIPKLDQYLQHIEDIPGNTDEVWYNIPEYGVRMKLNKEFAEELIYSDGMVDDFSKARTGIYFSTKAITEVAPECAPGRGGAMGLLSKSEGNIKEKAKSDEILSERVDDYTQIADYYYGWVGPQATCWFLSHKDEAEKEWAKTYGGDSGAKNLYEGSKTIQLIPAE